MEILKELKLLELFSGFIIGVISSFLGWRFTTLLKPSLEISSIINDKKDRGLIKIRNKKKRNIMNIQISLNTVDTTGYAKPVKITPSNLLALKKRNSKNNSQNLADNFEITIQDLPNLKERLINGTLLELTINLVDSLSNMGRTMNKTFNLNQIK